MEIGWPTDVRHVAHVTFDRFHGFLGLPVEFEPEVPCRAPSASAKVFGVSTESMQCSYDSRGNSIPTILLLMQRRLYDLGGLQTEGIFRITADNSQENHVRDQLNCGKLPVNIDVHCLAGLIKAWFRELPTGVLDSLSSENVMQCRTEEDCAQLTKLLPPSECALLDWAINLMADVVNDEQHNKMNAHNVATVFAPNMTQMTDPLTALMYAVQVMNFLRLLILKTLKERQEATLQDKPAPNTDRSDENGHSNPQFHSEACSQSSKKAMLDAIVPNELVCSTNFSIAHQEESSSDPGSAKTSHANVALATTKGSTSKHLCEISHGTDGSSNLPQSTAANSNAIHINGRTACSATRTTERKKPNGQTNKQAIEW